MNQGNQGNQGKRQMTDDQDISGLYKALQGVDGSHHHHGSHKGVSPLEEEKMKIIQELHEVKDMIIQEILTMVSQQPGQHQQIMGEPMMKKKRSCGRKKRKEDDDVKVFNISLGGGSSCPERPYLSDPLKEGVIAPRGKILRTLNPPLQMVLPNAKRFQNRVKHQGQDCLCGLELNRVMDNVDEKWSRILLKEQKKNNYLEQQIHQLQQENDIYKRNYIRMTPEMMADPLFLHGEEEQIPHSLSNQSKRRSSKISNSRKSCR